MSHTPLSRRLRVWNLININVPLVLLLEEHLLFNLLFLNLLHRGQIKVVDDVRNIGNAIGVCGLANLLPFRLFTTLMPLLLSSDV